MREGEREREREKRVEKKLLGGLCWNLHVSHECTPENPLLVSICRGSNYVAMFSWSGWLHDCHQVQVDTIAMIAKLEGNTIKGLNLVPSVRVFVKLWKISLLIIIHSSEFTLHL